MPNPPSAEASLPAVEEDDDVRVRDLAAAISGLQRPRIFRQAVADWPVVATARQSSDALIDHLKARDNGQPCETFRQPAGDGKFFYGDGGDGLNFRRARVPLGLTLERLRALGAQGSPEHIYIQSAPLADHMPRLMAENSLPGIAAAPRIWIGNRAITQIHFDLYENLVCMVGGRKRFVLFPPDQVKNLYMGPLETTVSGVPTSMVDFERPDFAAHPRFRDALKTAAVADLEPGDVLYIPYMWWHHVVSDGAFNVQINYWWNPAEAMGQPIHALFHALLSLRDLPPGQNAAWKAMFDHLVFHQSGPVADHLPAGQRGIMGELDEAARQAIRKQLGRNLTED